MYRLVHAVSGWALVLVGLLIATAGFGQTASSNPDELPTYPLDFPLASYQDLARSDQQIYAVDRQQSWVHIKVYRGGLLSRLGHNHIFSTRLIHGLAASGNQGVRADFFIRLEDLQVDLPELRRQAGKPFNSEPSPADIAATRRNMLGDRVLDVASKPFVELSFAIDDGVVVTELTLKGVTRSLPVDLPAPGFESQPLGGQMRLRLSDFGIEPFTTLAGMLRVKDEIEIEYQLQLRHLGPDEDEPSIEQVFESAPGSLSGSMAFPD